MKLINLSATFYCSCLLLFTSLLLSPMLKAQQNNADSLFSEYEQQVFQVQIIEKNSNKKSAIGSGFLIDGGYIVTNYHVVSLFINAPNQYRVELLANDKSHLTANLVNFDVVNDLAILSAKPNTEQALVLATKTPRQGEAIYSIGNPHDYGMIVVPGTYNGITAHSFYQRIHFTGSINPGMSGGPVLNSQGEVIGVNVATAGNQLGFLVPLDKLVNLVSNTHQVIDQSTYNQQIENQLFNSQDQLYTDLLNKSWQTTLLGKAQVLTEIAPYIPCWGQSNAEAEKAQFKVSDINCISKEQLYINRSFRSGNIEIQFSWLEKDKLNAIQFSQLLEQSFSRAAPGNQAGEKQVTNFQCQQDFTSATPETSQFKTTLCVRNYKQYPSLYDVLYMSVSVHNNDAALMSHFTLSGVSQNNAQAFTRKFMETVKWN